jgi:putative ABC transport system permease protein
VLRRLGVQLLGARSGPGEGRVLLPGRRQLLLRRDVRTGQRPRRIGVRRALGATRRHIRLQFLIESTLLAGLGGAVGVGLGSAITWLYADTRGWRFAVPLTGLLGGVAAALAVGAVAGLYPAVRASRLAPAEAVRSE